jgi:diacylglycerol kinase (ATP)
VFTGAKHLRASRTRLRVRVDGDKWFDGQASCVLIGNVGKLFGGVTAFEHARPDDGRLELGVVTADGIWQWARALARTASGHADKSPFVQTTNGTRFDIKLQHAVPYELDGGDRKPVKRLKVSVVPDAITVCVPTDVTP